MSQQPPQRDPYADLQRLITHVAHLTRQMTEQADFFRRMEPMIRIALLVWIAFPALLLMMVLFYLVRLVSR